LRGERETLLCQKYVRTLSDNAGLVSPLADGLAGPWRQQNHSQSNAQEVGIDRRTAAAGHFRRLGFKGTPEGMLW